MEQNVSKSSFYFVGSLSAIVLVGVIMVYSSSYIYAKEVIGSSGHFFFKQLIFLLMGISLALVTSKTKISFWYKFAYYLHIIFVGFLLLTLIKPFAETINGSTRWVSLGLFKFQPGEFVKISTLLVATSFFNEFEKLTNKERVQKSAMLLAPLGIFAIQPDFGSLFICTAIIGFSCFMSSFPRRYFYGLTLLATGLLTLLVFVERYRVKRLLTFLDPWSSPKGSGFQIIQSYLAFANGSFWGQGLGNSHEKLFYLPEAYNDFIFSVIGEELGFFGVFCITALFIVFIYNGFKLSLELKKSLGTILVTTIIFTISLQALLNMGVVLGLLPTKGLNLPFISYGGSSLISNFWGIGLIYSCYFKESSLDSLETKMNPLSSRFHTGQTL